jgi:hypothetical protein
LADSDCWTTRIIGLEVDESSRSEFQAQFFFRLATVDRNDLVALSRGDLDATVIVSKPEFGAAEVLFTGDPVHHLLQELQASHHVAISPSQ